MSERATIDGDRLLADLAELRSIGAQGTGVHRPAFAPDDRRAREWLRQRMQDAGLDAHIDGIGNVHGRSAAPRAVLSGSHCDTVPAGGWLDGAFGVIVALEAARVLNAGSGSDSGSDGVGLDVIVFADEEGRFRGTLGSRAFCGGITDAELAAATAGDGARLADALAETGWAGRPITRLDRNRYVAFLEAHIEQGPVLEAAGDDVGIVTGIVGMRRTAVSFHGRTDHAGATPMAMRHDAGAAAVEFAAGFVTEMRRRAGEHTVWNVGALDLHPGFGNIVPDRGDVVIEYRDLDADLLAGVDDVVPGLVAAAAERNRATHSIEIVVKQPPLATDARLMTVLDAAAERHGVRHRRMPSGAGHDAMIVGYHLPTAMLFSPSIGGRSHCDAEDTRPEDLVRTAQVFTTALGEVMRSVS